jgi:hypothetical protein
MNEAFGRLLAASDDERRDVFLTTGRRLGTAVQNIEKDFWACWTLDVLFNGLPENHPRLLSTARATRGCSSTTPTSI